LRFPLERSGLGAPPDCSSAEYGAALAEAVAVIARQRPTQPRQPFMAPFRGAFLFFAAVVILGMTWDEGNRLKADLELPGPHQLVSGISPLGAALVKTKFETAGLRTEIWDGPVSARGSRPIGQEAEAYVFQSGMALMSGQEPPPPLPPGNTATTNIQPDGTLKCPSCGSTQFETKRSTGRKVMWGVGALLGSASEVQCVACGRRYKRG